jgi:hypothetical protein
VKCEGRVATYAKKATTTTTMLVFVTRFISIACVYVCGWRKRERGEREREREQWLYYIDTSIQVA